VRWCIDLSTWRSSAVSLLMASVKQFKGNYHR